MPPQPWPVPLDPEAQARRHDAALDVQRRGKLADLGSYDDPESEPMLLDDHEVAAGWDADIDRLLAEAIESRSGDQLVELPAQLSTTAVLRLNADSDGFAAELARPMPRQPSRSARFGTRFHHWVEHYFGGRPQWRSGPQHPLILDDLPDRADSGTDDEQELREVCEAFAAGRFGSTMPYAIEAPFSIWMAGRLIRGRIDAVYLQPTPFAGGATRFQVVDWKTGRTDTADPLQLAIYRLAWAEAYGLPAEEIDAVFYHVRTDEVVRPAALPDRLAIESILSS